jgi:hypothetical protein
MPGMTAARREKAVTALGFFGVYFHIPYVSKVENFVIA